MTTFRSIRPTFLFRLDLVDSNIRAYNILSLELGYRREEGPPMVGLSSACENYYVSTCEHPAGQQSESIGQRRSNHIQFLDQDED